MFDAKDVADWLMNEDGEGATDEQFLETFKLMEKKIEKRLSDDYTFYDWLKAVIGEIQQNKEEKMKNYKEFEQESIGYSDIATLILVGCDENGLKTGQLSFGGDGRYEAYIVTEPDAEIGSHYNKVTTFNHWLKIYDDDGLTYRVDAKEINIYRAGEFGCIIQIIQ